MLRGVTAFTVCKAVAGTLPGIGCNITELSETIGAPTP